MNVINFTEKRKKKVDKFPCQLELYPQVQSSLERLWETNFIPHILEAFVQGLLIMLEQFTSNDGRYQTNEMLEFTDEIIFLSEISQEIRENSVNNTVELIGSLIVLSADPIFKKIIERFFK